MLPNGSHVRSNKKLAACPSWLRGRCSSLVARHSATMHFSFMLFHLNTASHALWFTSILLIANFQILLSTN